MKPENTEAQRKKRHDAMFSAVLHMLILAVTAGVLLYVRQRYVLSGLWGTVTLISVVLDLGMCIPIWIILRERLNEIDGGEEDAAAQY